MDQIGGAEFDFWFGTYVDMRKWLKALEHITKHFKSKQSIKQHRVLNANSLFPFRNISVQPR